MNVFYHRISPRFRLFGIFEKEEVDRSWFVMMVWAITDVDCLLIELPVFRTVHSSNDDNDMAITCAFEDSENS